MEMASGEFLWEKRMYDRSMIPWDVDMTEVINICLLYFPKENIYTDHLGETVYDIFELLFPADVEMFLNRPYGNVFFLHRDRKDILIELRHIGPSVNYNPELRREVELRRWAS